MKIIIRKEEQKDFKAVYSVIKKAFEAEKMSDHKEQFLVQKLRESKAFIPALSMVAEPMIKSSDIFCLLK